MSDYQTLKLERNEGIAVLTLDRPEAANGIDGVMGQELNHAATAIDEDASIRAVLIAGGEGKMFCAGGDLKSFAQYGDEIGAKIKALTTDLHAAISRFNRMDKPVIIAVNGMAAGAGFSLAISGDIVLAAESAKFTMAYTAAGLSPDGSSSYFMPRLIGLRKTQELMFTNRRLSAQEAQDWGLVSKVVADAELQQEAISLAKKLANGPTLAFGQVKQLLLSSSDNSLETQMELESRGIAAMTKTADGVEGISAFMEKRAATFSGK